VEFGVILKAWAVRRNASVAAKPAAALDRLRQLVSTWSEVANSSWKNPWGEIR
jgi:hypothetical protein